MGLREKWLQARDSEELLTSGADTTLNQFEVREYVLGEHLFQVGQSSHELFLLLSGTVLVYLECEDGTRTIAEIKAPEFVGEMGCLQGEPHTSNAMVTETCRVLVIPEAEIDRIVAAQPRWFVTLIDTLLQRLRAADARLASLVPAEPARQD